MYVTSTKTKRLLGDRIRAFLQRTATPRYSVSEIGEMRMLCYQMALKAKSSSAIYSHEYPLIRAAAEDMVRTYMQNSTTLEELRKAVFSG